MGEKGSPRPDAIDIKLSYNQELGRLSQRLLNLERDLNRSRRYPELLGKCRGLLLIIPNLSLGKNERERAAIRIFGRKVDNLFKQYEKISQVKHGVEVLETEDEPPILRTSIQKPSPGEFKINEKLAGVTLRERYDYAIWQLGHLRAEARRSTPEISKWKQRVGYLLKQMSDGYKQIEHGNGKMVKKLADELLGRANELIEQYLKIVAINEKNDQK